MRKTNKNNGRGDPEKGIIRDLDGILPEVMDRRSFFKMSLASITAGGLAGCTGSGGSGGGGDSGGSGGGGDSGSGSGGGGDSGSGSGGDGGGSGDSKIWRSAWKNEPSYTIAHMAQRQGFWEDAGITSPTAKRGYGSGDTTKRIGTGQETIGMSSYTAQMSGLDSGLDIKAVGVAKDRNMMILAYNKDKFPNGLEDFKAGKVSGDRVATGQTISKLTWPIFQKAADVPKSFQPKTMDDDTSNTLFLQKKLDGKFTLLHHWAKIRAKADFTVGGIPLYKYLPLYGYTIIVNKSFLDESQKNLDYTTSVLEGYSHASKWTLLNPEKALDTMINDVNPQLQTIERGVLVDALKAGVFAPNLTDNIKQNGLSYLSKEIAQTSLDGFSKQMELNDEITTDELIDWRPQENASLAKLSKDEWNQATEYAQTFIDLFYT